MDENQMLIESLGLTDEQVEKIVLEWYTSDRCDYILQDEYGQDLEEIIG